MKKILALVLALMLVLGMTSAFAASITIARDDSFNGTGNGNAYQYYKIFSADYQSNTSTGGGYDNSGLNGVSGSASNAAYTATQAVANVLGEWKADASDDQSTPDIDESKPYWHKATGNLWFDLTPIAGTTNYSVTWVGANSNSDTVQAAADWLIDNNAYEAGPTDLTFNTSTSKWESGTIANGYYVVKGEAGSNLIAATSDINIKEKMEYPPLDKTQADEDNTTQNDDDRDVAVGDVLDYEVKVTIPRSVKAGDRILVWDKPSQGLTYNGTVTVKSGTNSGNATVAAAASADQVAGAAWTQVITITNATSQAGTDVVFCFSMTVNQGALVDMQKENESGLKYGDEDSWFYDSLPDQVEYKTYFAGIHKVDKDDHSIDLEGVQFTLQEKMGSSAAVDFKVSPVRKGGTGTDKDDVLYYVPDANGSATVTTDKDGLIRIRGLDNSNANKVYTLTETLNPNPGYNMLTDKVTLTLSLDAVVKYTQATTYDSSATYYTKESNGTFTQVTVADATAFGAGIFYTRSGSNTYDGTTKDTWQLVENGKGNLLPSTGGIGTTLFYIGGGILILLAVVLLVTKKRMSAND